MEVETEVEEIGAQKRQSPFQEPRKELSPVEEVESPLEKFTEQPEVLPKIHSQSVAGSSKAPQQLAPTSSADTASKMSIDGVIESVGTSALNDAAKMSIDLAEESETTHKDAESTSKMSIDGVEMPSDKFAESADENMSNRLDAPVLASASKPLKVAETPTSSDRKRSRSPLRSVQYALKKLSPNRSATKVQKLKNQWPPSNTKQRQSFEDVDMYEGNTKKLIGQSAFARPMPSSSPFDPQATTLTGGAPRVFQATLNSKVLAMSQVTSAKSGSVLSEEARKKEEDRKARANNAQGKIGRLEEMRAKVSY